jgi:hypothetical protein
MFWMVKFHLMNRSYLNKYNLGMRKLMKSIKVKHTISGNINIYLNKHSLRMIIIYCHPLQITILTLLLLLQFCVPREDWTISETGKVVIVVMHLCCICNSRANCFGLKWCQLLLQPNPFNMFFLFHFSLHEEMERVLPLHRINADTMLWGRS